MEHVSHSGATPLITCQITNRVERLSIQCAYLRVCFTFLHVLTSLLTFSQTLADHRKVIGFSFDSHQAAREIWLCVEKLISDPENIALSAPGRKRKTPKKQKIVLPPKSQISLPCQFHHVTSVTRNDTSRFFSLQAFVSPSSRKRDI